MWGPETAPYAHSYAHRGERQEETLSEVHSQAPPPSVRIDSNLSRVAKPPRAGPFVRDYNGRLDSTSSGTNAAPTQVLIPEPMLRGSKPLRRAVVSRG